MAKLAFFYLTYKTQYLFGLLVLIGLSVLLHSFNVNPLAMFTDLGVILMAFGGVALEVIVNNTRK